VQLLTGSGAVRHALGILYLSTTMPRPCPSPPAKGVCHEIFHFRFFHESVYPDEDLISAIFTKIRGDIRKYRSKFLEGFIPMAEDSRHIK
jgi:hypothetical protein